MCDTLFFSNKDKRIFMKNSDRSCNEPNLCVYSPARKAGKELKCTYITIPDKDSFGCFLVKPSWIWGAEMGINEKGVAIGNEAVFTKTQQKKESLIGMDYLRLALERSSSAREAVDVIIALLKEYGQGGNCGYDHYFYYDNSYLIADKKETYILETAGKDYAVKKCEDKANISNKLRIGTDYTFSSKEFPKGFEKTFSDFFFTTGSCSRKRQACGEKCINTYDVSIENAFKILGTHEEKNNIFLKGDVGSLNMIESMLGDHTTGSIVIDLSQDNPTIWITGSSMPCLSVFKPYYMGLENELVSNISNQDVNYWKTREYLQRGLYSDLGNIEEYKKEVDKLQEKFIKEENTLRNKKTSIEELKEFANKCVKEENKLISKYNDVIEKAKNPNNLKGQWKKYTSNFNGNPFGKTVEERKG